MGHCRFFGRLPLASASNCTRAQVDTSSPVSRAACSMGTRSASVMRRRKRGQRKLLIHAVPFSFHWPGSDPGGRRPRSDCCCRSAPVAAGAAPDQVALPRGELRFGVHVCRDNR
jgi:hypothetical protein